MTTAIAHHFQAAAKSPRRGVVLENVSWETYEMLLRDVEEQHVYLTYDRGVLQIMPPPLPVHEKTGRFLERLVHAYTEERNIPICSFGAATWRRRDVAGGLEADNCYYIQNEPSVRHAVKIDLTHSPPPDLAIEVDVTSSAIDKFGVYGRLGVPEVWRCENNQLIVAILQDGAYAPTRVSHALPKLPLAEVQRFLDLRTRVGETECVRAFREWVRSQPD
jgi:Uma2 family endonuclease